MHVKRIKGPKLVSVVYVQDFLRFINEYSEFKSWFKAEVSQFMIVYFLFVEKTVNHPKIKNSTLKCSQFQIQTKKKYKDYFLSIRLYRLCFICIDGICSSPKKSLKKADSRILFIKRIVLKYQIFPKKRYFNSAVFLKENHTVIST